MRVQWRRALASTLVVLGWLCLGYWLSTVSVWLWGGLILCGFGLGLGLWENGDA